MKRKNYLFALITLSLFTIHYFTFSQGCLPEGITFNTQQQIDDFQTNYPGCVEIEGSVSISGIDISNLDGLSQITSIGGKLFLWGFNNAVDMDGLGNLISIGDSLQIMYNNHIPDLNSFSNLAFIGSSLIISYNNSLNDLSGLMNITMISESIELWHNPNLTDLAGLNSITEIGSDLRIGQNSLVDLNGLNSLQSIYGNLTVEYSSISNLEGLESLCLINGNMAIGFNDSLINLNGLNNLEEIHGELYVDGNPYLHHFSGLENLEFIGDDLFVQFSSLESFAGLYSLETIGVDIKVFSNPFLTTFDGLNNLEMIGGFVRIYDNPSLTSLQALTSLTLTKGFNVAYNISLTSVSGLDNVEPDSIVAIEIVYNDLLSECDVYSVCNYITMPWVYFNIFENAPGCNSPEEVEEACLTGTEKYVVGKSDIQIFPNPAKKTITLLNSSDDKIRSITIYNLSGQIVLQKNAPINAIDISSLQAGLYFVEVETENGKVRRKLIVE